MSHHANGVKQEPLFSEAPSDDQFEAFWKAYPPRDGQNPRAIARREFIRQVKRGASPSDLVGAARAFRAECKTQDLLHTPYVPHARTWLYQERWRDILENEPEPSAEAEQAPQTIQGFSVAMLKRELDKAQRGWPHDRTAVRVAKQAGLE
jgi:hypothetical protein